MKIAGNTVGTPMPRTNYEQTDPTKADYLKGKTELDQKIDNAQTAANNAKTTADNAQTAADNAQTAAGNAVDIAMKKIDRDGTSAMDADFDVGGHNIVNLADPVRDTDAVTKKFVEDVMKNKLSMELLWENASPASGFSEQTITFKDIGADLYEVHFTCGTGERLNVLRIKPGEIGLVFAGSGSDDYATGAITFFVRKITASTKTSISFSNNFYTNVYLSWTNWSTSSGMPVPIKVFGIKGVSA